MCDNYVARGPEVYTEEMKSTTLRLLAQGMSRSKIARHIGLRSANPICRFLASRANEQIVATLTGDKPVDWFGGGL